MLCAGNQDEGADTCQVGIGKETMWRRKMSVEVSLADILHVKGDSGGPLISRGGAGGYSLVLDFQIIKTKIQNKTRIVNAAHVTLY